MLKKVLAIATIVGILGFGGMEVEAAPHLHAHRHAPSFHDRGHGPGHQPPPVFRHGHGPGHQPPPVFRHGHEPGHQPPHGFRQ